MTITALTVARLKQVKNAIIGNPQAKSALSTDNLFISSLVDAVNPPPSSPADPDTSHDALVIESAVVIASLSASDAALLVLLRAQAPRALLYALSRLPSSDQGTSHAQLRAALARALRALAAATADVVGPPLWGLLKQPSRDLLEEARSSIDVFVSMEALDVYLPFLVLPNPPKQPSAHAILTATAVAQLLGLTLRTPAHLSLVTSWVPPATRAASAAFSPTSPTSASGATVPPRSKRGWEKTAIPGTGGVPIVVRWLLALLNGSKDVKLIESVLNALAALVKENPVLAGHLGRAEKDFLPMTTILGFTKSRSSDVQIAACLCVTHTLRALPPAPPPPPPPHFPHAHAHASSSSHSHGHGHGHSHSLSLGHSSSTGRSGIGSPGAAAGSSTSGRSSTSGTTGGNGGAGGLPVEEVGVRTVLGVVNRILGTTSGESAQVRTKACFVLHYLVADDAQLCHAAFDRGCLDVLGALIQEISPQEPAPPEWEEGESEALQNLREASLTALASLALASDDARRRIASPPPSLLPCLARALRATQHTGTRYAAAQCVRAMARSVSVLRTSIVDSGLGMDVLRVVLGRPLGGRFGGAVAGSMGLSGTNTARGKECDAMDVSGVKDSELGEDRRVLGAALSAVCNIVNDFSPLRPIYLEEGLMPRLVYILRETSDGPLRLSALWAVKNLVRKASSETKRDVMSHIGWAELDNFLDDPDEAFKEQAFNLLRNLAENEDGIAMIFRELGPAVLTRLLHGLSSSSTDVVLQAAYALANLTNGTGAQQDSILGAPGILSALASCLAEGPPAVRRPCVSAVLTLAQRNPRRRREMQEAGIVNTLKRLSEWSGHGPAPVSSGAGSTGASGMGLSPSSRGSGAGAAAAGGGAWSPGAWGAHQAGVHAHSGSGTWAPGTWSGSGGVMHAALGAGRTPSASSHLVLEDDREVVSRARLALEWLEHGETYVS
ncbi:ARM repeat-containing protein [Pholiota conissans]|uniref:ARM repeat-containing protein n=1 Tax=Pholiota conissans TaxID=109636 RepID=A0A9P5YM27_9AGAR|nr:ARM repeat-containing protein [Pholiota conissans]